MRIGLFTDAYYPQVSGVVTSVDMLRQGLESMGHSVFVFTTTPIKGRKVEDDPAKIIRFKGVKIPIRALKGYKLSTFLRSKLKEVEKYKLDIIHCHTEFTMGRLGYLASNKYNIPMIYTYHTMYEEYFGYLSKLLNRFFRPFLIKILKWVISYYSKKAVYVIVPTKKVECAFESLGLKIMTNIIPSGLELQHFYRSSYEEEDILTLRRSLGIQDDEIVYLFVGRVSNEKSIDVLIKEYTKVCHNIKSKFLILGDGPFMSELKKLIQTYQLEEKVILTGMIPWSNVGLYYQVGDIFLNASMTETQGLTYIEALAAGLVVVVKKDLNLLELIKNYENGIFFEKNEELSTILLKIDNDKSIVDVIRKNAKDSVAHYSKYHYASNILELYEDAYQKKTIK